LPSIIASLLLLAVVCLTGTGPLVAAHANSVQWSGDSIQYNVGDKVTYNDNLYQCLQAHTSQPNWNPERTLGVFWQRTSNSSNTATTFGFLKKKKHHPPRNVNGNGNVNGVNNGSIDPKMYYYIRSELDGYVLDVRGNSTTPGGNGVPAIAYPQDSANTATAAPNQLWKFVAANNGRYYIESQSGLFLDIQDPSGGGNLPPNTPVVAFTQDPGTAFNQVWTTDSGTRGIHIRNSGLVLDIQGNNTAINAPVDAYTEKNSTDPNGTSNQLWDLEAVQPTSGVGVG